jgi:hypothetical protein
MKAIANPRRSRRTPMERDRYRAVARVSGVRPRLRRPRIAIDAALIAIAIVFVLLATPRIASAVGAGADDFGAKLAEIFPALQGSKPIDLPTTGATVTTQLAADNLPDFTREPSLKLTGRVPAFAMVAGRVVEVGLNGKVATTLAPDAAGAYATTLTLVEGPNPIVLRLLSGTDVIATSSYLVVLDRVAPGLVVTKPQPNDTVDGPNVIVTGKAEAGATVVVNDRVIVPGQDGSFNESFPAAAGPFTVTVLARDRAGNETTVKTAITVKAATTTAPLQVLVILDKVKVTPGQFVTADILVTANGLPKIDEQVSLSVGVVPIATARTDSNGRARISFFAPPNEGEASVVVLATGASGRAALTVAK